MLSRQHGWSTIEIAMALPAMLLLIFGSIDIANYYRTYNGLLDAVTAVTSFGSNVEMRAGQAIADTQTRRFDWYSYVQPANKKSFKLVKNLVASGVVDGVTPAACNPPPAGISCSKFFTGTIGGLHGSYNINVLELMQLGLNSLDATFPNYKTGCSGPYCLNFSVQLTDAAGLPIANPSHVYALATTQLPLLSLFHHTVDVSVSGIQRIERALLDNVNLEVNYSPVGSGLPGLDDP